jgi:hypothetical protein
MLGTREEVVDLTFSIIGTTTGVLGTLLGGAWLDAAGSDIQHANVFCTVCSAIAAASAVLSFVGVRTLPPFIISYALANLACCAISGPASAPLPPGPPWLTQLFAK